MPRKSEHFYLCYRPWLGRRFWNQTFEEELELKKGQSLEQEIQEIRQLLDEGTLQSEELQC
jgi:hypothetical protein